MPTEMTTPSASRDELRAKLRGKIRDGRKSHHAPSNPRNVDIGGELLRRGIDDPEMLNLAKSIGNNPQQAVSMLRSKLSELQAEEDEEAPPPPPSSATRRDDSDDEECPPPARS